MTPFHLQLTKEPAIRQHTVYAQMLWSRHYSVTAVSDAASAIRASQNQSFELLIRDVILGVSEE
jgi:hypothetical protein